MPKLAKVAEYVFSAVWNFLAVYGLMSLRGNPRMRDSIAVMVISTSVSLGAAWLYMRRVGKA